MYSMGSKKESIYSLFVVAILMTGFALLVLRRPTVEIEKKPVNTAEITAKSKKIASQNGETAVFNELSDNRGTIFIEPAEPAENTDGDILGLENSAIEGYEAPVSEEKNTDVGVKLLPPRDQESLDKLLKTLRGFGDFFSLPYEELIDPEGAFAAQDKDVVEMTRYTFRNPTSFKLGQQCGLPGSSFSYPPGRDAGPKACGGTPGYGGTSCNTSPQCYFSGKCFWVCTPSGCSCTVQSCYGACGGGAAYIWDSVTKTCGCGR